jgi:glycosyltransferase involved in cell wall biosynthesis
MSPEEFQAYRDRLVDFVEAYIDEIEALEGQPITHAIAHHSFLNPVVLCDVNERRTIRGKQRIPFSVFVHGTGLKMFLNELGSENSVEFPMRFTLWAREQNALGKATNCFIISAAEHSKLMTAFPELTTPITLSPNGVNQLIFRPFGDRTPESRDLILSTLTTAPYEGSSEVSVAIPEAARSGKLIVFVGKFADWKRLDAVLYAAKAAEQNDALKEAGGVFTLIVGSGPLESQILYQDMARELGLEQCYFLGPQQLCVLAQLYSCADVGVFPAYHEPFGMVLVETMACGTPVIGAASGGPLDFVTDAVGGLVPETKTLASDEEEVARFRGDLGALVIRALVEDWKGSKGAAALALAQEKYSTSVQVNEMVRTWEDIWRSTHAGERVRTVCDRQKKQKKKTGKHSCLKTTSLLYVS